MLYSYSQLAQFLSCPRRYRFRYLEGWQEKDTRAALLFGRAFENALAALFRREDAGATFFKEWSVHQDTDLDYTRGDTWRSMYDQGTKLLELFTQQDRVDIRYPRRNLQVRVSKRLTATSEFIGYIDAYGFLDGTRCVIDWKTTTARYPEEPEGLLSLDPPAGLLLLAYQPTASRIRRLRSQTTARDPVPACHDHGRTEARVR